MDATTGAAPVPVPPPRPVVMKTMSAPFEGVADLLGVLHGGLPAHVGVGARSESLGQLAADLDLDRRAVGAQGLEVGVDRDELDPLQARRRSSG